MIVGLGGLRGDLIRATVRVVPLLLEGFNPLPNLVLAQYVDEQRHICEKHEKEYVQGCCRIKHDVLILQLCDYAIKRSKC